MAIDDKDLTNLESVRSLDFAVSRIGAATITSPLRHVPFVDDGARVSFFSDAAVLAKAAAAGAQAVPGFVVAGPRRRIFHDPAWTRAAIVTCGGLCPGINDVIKGLVNTLHFSYGVDNVFGIRYGFCGLIPEYRLEPLILTPDVVDTIHESGGSILGTSRGPQDTDEMVRTLDRLNITILFTIGGDGTQRGALDIAEAARKKGLSVSVVGIPKTIDNDLNMMERTFGFETAVYATGAVIGCAHDEAKGAMNGIGLVKLMGRESGFIAACAALANSVVNFCLIPEVPFLLEGPHGFLPALERRLLEKNHAVITVAEGAGQNLFADGSEAKDASGNRILDDIGLLLKDRIQAHFRRRGIEHAVKYFDPSYIIRSVPARGMDAIFCLHLAQNAVHAAMAGMTGLVVGYWHGHFTCVPIRLAAYSRRHVDPRSQLWQSVLEVTRQEEYWRP